MEHAYYALYQGQHNMINLCILIPMMKTLRNSDVSVLTSEAGDL